LGELELIELNNSDSTTGPPVSTSRDRAMTAFRSSKKCTSSTALGVAQPEAAAVISVAA
jgi:hypothetical protein